MGHVAAELRHLPLFRALSEEQLAEILGLFRERSLAAGEVIFREGEVPTALQLLVEGSIELREAHEPKLRVSPPAPVGELGALTGVPRNTTAVAITPGRILEADTTALAELFARSNGIAFAFHRAFLELVAGKVRRDRARLDDMRANLVRTQKRMKALREIVLSNLETPISQPVCDALDELIENNRRAHYRVVPTQAHPASLKLDDRVARVVELSEGFIKIDREAGLAVGSEISAVLVLPQAEMAISARVTRAGADGILLKLDLLIDEYRNVLLGYVTQLQLLDFVV